MSDFADTVKKVVSKIPKGKTMSYGEVAVAAGSPLAHRAVASLMKKNWDSDVPCHRVIHSDGRVGKYNREGGEEVKIKKLKAEGVIIKDGHVVTS